MRLMTAHSAKRWARRLLFVWLGMWLSTALLPCSEVEAAVAAYEQAQGSDCGHPAEPAPGSGHKAAGCMDIDAPAPASADSLAGPIAGSATQPALPAPSYTLPRQPASSLAPANRAAPPPVAVFLRTPRLLI